MKCLFIVIIVLLSSNIYAQRTYPEIHVSSLKNQKGKTDCRPIKNWISDGIKTIRIIRPLGRIFDTTEYNVGEKEILIGPRLITLGKEKVQCRDIVMAQNSANDLVEIHLDVTGYNLGGPYTQDFVNKYYERNNHPLLNEKLPEIQGAFLSGRSFNSTSQLGKKTLLHFSFLGCRGCMQEQVVINKLVREGVNVNIILVTPDSVDKLNKYLVKKDDHYEIHPPYNKLCDKILTPILPLPESVLNSKFILSGYPLNLLIDEHGTVVKCDLKSIYPEEFSQSISQF